MEIRPFDATDYDAIAAVVSRAVPAMPATAEEMRQADARTRDGERYVVEQDGAVVGFTHFFHSPAMKHPHKFELGIYVDPPHQGRGHGAALYRALRQALRPYRPIALRTAVREDDPRGERFLHDRGFQEITRVREAVLDLDRLPVDGAQAAVRRVLDQGTQLRSLPELAGDPGRDRRLYELELESTRDQPLPEGFTPPTLEEFTEQTLGHPGLVPDAYYVAVAGERYVGVTSLWRSPAGNELTTRGTGVVRDYRGQGIAWALKCRCALWAKAHGYRWIRTWTDSRNEPMAQINQRFGFVGQPGWITVVLPLAAESDR